MTVDLTQKILDIDGKPSQDQDGSDLTIGTLIRRSLLAGNREDDEATKLEKYDLAITLGGVSAELTAANVVLIRKAAAELWAPLALGRLRDAIDPKGKADPKPKKEAKE